MAQIAHEQTPRISQVLPTVKCSSCGLPVPFASLGDHVCAPLPPRHVLSLRQPALSPKSALPQRPLLRSDAHTPFSERPSQDGGPVPAPSRDPSQRLPPDAASTPHSPLARPPDARTPPPDRVSTPSRDPLPPSLQRARTPSNPRRPSPRPAYPAQPSDSPARHALGRPAALSPAPRENVPPPRSPFTIHPSSNTTPRPLFDRAHTPSQTVSASRPSLHAPRPSLDKLPPSLDVRRPSLPYHTSTEQDQAAPPSVPIPRPPVRGISSPALGPVPFPVLPPTTRQPPPPPLSLARHREIDTKIGGEAGMAGVGRRGFAAAARAAMLVASPSPVHQPLGGHSASQYLDRNITFGHVLQAAMTPPSSPNPAQTPSPVSPLAFPVPPVSLGNSTGGQHPRLPSPHDTTFQPAVPTSNDKTHPLPISPGVRIASPSRSPPPIPNPFERRLSGETIAQSPMPADNLLLPFLDVLKPELDLGDESDDESVYTTHTDLKKDGNISPSPSADSDVGLAYAQDSDDDTPVVMPLDIRKSAASGDRQHPLGPSRQISGASSRSALSTSSTTTSLVSTVRSRSTTTTQSPAKSVGALARAMETLIEEGASVSVLASGSVLASIGGSAPGRGTGKPSRSNTVPGPASPEQRPPKLPTRSHTSPSNPHVHSERVGITGEVARIRNRVLAKQRDRVCAGCGSKIEDGRWIQMDGGNVLCERCWKNMYLPKCRRCNLPIEKQAVSSRDGQLKGKYHKDCFSCHACQKPFPDKEFYVFDGKPFCAYHYHEANNSLCGASSCGQPIEGPCAVTHSGKRYHPEHLLCEFEDGCKERLEEYWEVDGQMLCECHATLVGSRDGGWTRGHDPAGGAQTIETSGRDEGRMMKRMTRFIDLGGGGDDELDIR